MLANVLRPGPADFFALWLNG
ncbi:hypothetical protein Rmet_6725 (plasmid) [Cupriavidus metallidurans CH34]|uniref:Uncharacterized protein n=1 Tax=Cupriavidus metallidurans (strain ATCC 43123 / DSM 2839 / NBRC 102507 / CH34) TaxID=266264 RepID=D3DYD4_CUPMC|nr:hypothetical protein Rmet_6725 [Cupriavidus metallidurans CH34]